MAPLERSGGAFSCVGRIVAMPYQFQLRSLFVVMLWIAVTLGLWRVVTLLFPLSSDSKILALWLTFTLLTAWVGGGFGWLFGKPVLGGVLGALIGFAFAF